MTIYFNDKLNQSLDVNVDDDSYRYRQVKNFHKLVLYYSLTHHVEIPVGAWVEYEGAIYTLTKPSNFTKNSTRDFSYTLTLEYDWAASAKYKLRNPVDGRLKFSYTAKPHEFVQLVVDNMNTRESGWKVGDCVDAVEQVISFNHAYCNDALGQIADAFNTEWDVSGKTIHLRKVEYYKDNPLSLAYGRGNGFKKEISRSNQDSSRAVEILYVQGGSENINPSKYGGSELLLPKNQELTYEGRVYVSSSDGLSIRRKGKTPSTKVEDSLDCSEISPKRVGTVSSVVIVDAEKHFYDFTDSSIPAELNFNDCIIGVETMTVIFQSGMLAGKEFDVKYFHEAKTVSGVYKAARRFEIVPQEIDGKTMPNETFKPVAGRDTYAVFHISLPDSYVCNNSDKSGASWDMFREAARYLYEHEGELFTFKGELDGIWAKKDWLNIGGRIKPGAYVLFSDEQFNQEGSLVRITGVKDFVNNPHSPVIELSNAPVTSSFSSAMNKVEETEVVVEDKYRQALQFSKRRFRDSQETITALGEAMEANFSNFSTSINPIAVQAMALLIGDESLQFVFVQSPSSTDEIPHNVTYNRTTKELSIPGGYLQHKTLGITGISSEHKASEHKTWLMPAYTSAVLTDAGQKYYVYAKVSKTAQTGVFIISPTPVTIEGVNGYYHLMLGILNSEFDEDRSYSSFHGFTEVLPGQVLTQRVVSSNGKNFMDFLNNAFRIGDDNCYLDWNSSVANSLGIKNANIQIANVAGKTMVYFNGTNGSGQLAGGNITWDAEGNIKAKGGTFSNVKIEGSLRSPFSAPSGSFTTDFSDNAVLISSVGGMLDVYNIPWDISQSGRRVCLVNYRWGNSISQGGVSVRAPGGKYFYEDGIQKSVLTISRQVVELMGYGDESTFFGWIVLRRINMATTHKYGRSLNVLAQGIVTGTSSGASIRYKAFDDGTLTVSRLGEGRYRVNFPSSWGLTAGNYIVMLSGYGYSADFNESPIKASLNNPTSSYFGVDTSDDASRNDGSFMFQIINLNDWE